MASHGQGFFNFGSPKPSSTTAMPSNNSSTTAPHNIFGHLANPNIPTSNLFAPPRTDNSAGSPFGATPNASTPPVSNGGLFGPRSSVEARTSTASHSQSHLGGVGVKHAATTPSVEAAGNDNKRVKTGTDIDTLDPVIFEALDDNLTSVFRPFTTCKDNTVAKMAEESRRNCNKQLYLAELEMIVSNFLATEACGHDFSDVYHAKAVLAHKSRLQTMWQSNKKYTLPTILMLLLHERGFMVRRIEATTDPGYDEMMRLYRQLDDVLLGLLEEVFKACGHKRGWVKATLKAIDQRKQAANVVDKAGLYHKSIKFLEGISEEIGEGKIFSSLLV